MQYNNNFIHNHDLQPIYIIMRNTGRDDRGDFYSPRLWIVTEPEG